MKEEKVEKMANDAENKDMNAESVGDKPDTVMQDANSNTFGEEKAKSAEKVVVDNEKKRKRYLTAVGVLAGLAVLAIIVGVICFYFVTPDIDDTPTNLRVENYEGELYIVADYQEKFDYQFVIDALVDGEYIEIDAINSDKNALNLSKQDILLNAGNQFRFKVAYINENGANGDYSSYLEWTKVTPLDKIEVEVSGNVITWNSVMFAENYLLKITYPNGTQDEIDAGQNLSYTLSGTGTFQVYVVAVGDEGFYSSTSSLITITLGQTPTTLNADTEN